MTTLNQRLALLHERIQTACTTSNRKLSSVQLIGVSKFQPAESVADAHELGLADFGENYLQEAAEKIQHLKNKHLTWHFIGSIQSNKTKVIAESFHWVHTVDRLKIAQRLSSQCPPDKVLNILLQVNIDSDSNKGGVTAEESVDLVKQISNLPNLKLRGLMAILSQDTDPRVGYETVAQLHRDLKALIHPEFAPGWDTLSMGMTGDLEQAIAAGATMIRVGTALFGPRE
jgi:pyridoxal phosphate enzyme (YggS family)